MIKLSLPGLFDNYHILINFLQFYNENPSYFYDDRIIDSFYGADESQIWRGGRGIITPYKYNIEELIPQIEKYTNAKIRYTFTNCLITEEIANDYLCNYFVKNYFRSQDEVILNHPLLIQHFKRYYPNIPIIYSTTLGITDIKDVNNITKTNLYVLNYNYNNDQKYLSQLKYPNNIEIICAEPCSENCQFRMAHYTAISKEILHMKPAEDDFVKCPYIQKPMTFYEIMQRKHAITNERIKQLEKQKFEYYKLSGRGLTPIQWLEIILYYLAKPEYINHIRELLLKRLYHDG